MKNWVAISLGIASVICALLSCNSNKDEVNYIHIDNQTDFDKFSGNTFEPGDVILFDAGQIFNGQFVVNGSGTVDNSIKVTAYDSGSGEVYWQNIDNKPVINGHGVVNSAFLLYNGENWVISNIEVTNTDGTIEDQGDLRGIHVVARDFGVVNNVEIRNCFVHSVNGEVGGKQRGGIHVHVEGDSVPTKFNNLIIENNVIKNVGGVGIGNQSSWPGIDREGYNPWHGVVFRGNWVERTGRNGIIIRYSVDALVEYNTLAYNSRFSTGHSVFNFNTIGCVMQYNEAYGNTGDLDDIDRGGFDADFNARGTIIQYNYSHDNHWFCGIMRRYNRDVKIRYNISVNERMGAYMYGFPWVDDLRSIWVYNNTHYFRAGLSANVIASPGRDRVPGHTTFYNNIFYFEDEGDWGQMPDETCEWSNNLFYNVEPLGRNYIVADPLFVNPEHDLYDIDMHNPDRLSGFRLQNNSPAINTGIILNDNGGKDFWGNPLNNQFPDIGAHELQ